MNERQQQRQEAIEEYLHEFITKTNDGRVFTFDTSTLDTRQSNIRKELTLEERKEREEWAKTRSDLERHYRQKHRAFYRDLDDLSPEEMLRLRVIPSLLSDLGIATRSMPETNLERLYPGAIDSWADFATEVRAFTEPIVKEEGIVDDVLYFSLHSGMEVSNKNREQYIFLGQVMGRLEEAGLMKVGDRADAHLLNHSHPLGNSDRFLIAGRNKTVPIEFKATQDLLVPEKAVDMIHRYNAAFHAMQATNKRTVDWINIGHPVSQVISYMFLAKSRYGILSSGSRSYFFKVEVTDDAPRVFITDAWFIGQKDFLRAWAYLYHLAEENGDFELADGGEKEWPTWTPAIIPDRDQTSRKDGNDGQGGTDDDSPAEPPPKCRKMDNQDSGPGGQPTKRFMAWLNPSMAPSIPRVDSKDITFVRLLGVGNNCAYLANWKGNEVAVKVFDMFKDFAWFENEVRAYEHLKDSWGVLVPKPYFMADLYGTVLFGMQLGRAPNKGDPEMESKAKILFRTLRSKYGFDHLDLDARNVIYLPDSSGTGPDRLVAIDLESHNIRE